MSCRICLSVGKSDDSFCKMHAELSKYATVEMGGLEERDLSGFDIFIGKKMTEKMPTRLGRHFCLWSGFVHYTIAAVMMAIL